MAAARIARLNGHHGNAKHDQLAPEKRSKTGARAEKYAICMHPSLPQQAHTMVPYHTRNNASPRGLGAVADIPRHKTVQRKAFFWMFDDTTSGYRQVWRYSMQQLSLFSLARNYCVICLPHLFPIGGTAPLVLPAEVVTANGNLRQTYSRWHRERRGVHEEQSGRMTRAGSNSKHTDCAYRSLSTDAGTGGCLVFRLQAGGSYRHPRYRTATTCSKSAVLKPQRLL